MGWVGARHHNPILHNTTNTMLRVLLICAFVATTTAISCDQGSTISGTGVGCTAMDTMATNKACTAGLDTCYVQTLTMSGCKTVTSACYIKSACAAAEKVAKDSATAFGDLATFTSGCTSGSSGSSGETNTGDTNTDDTKTDVITMSGRSRATDTKTNNTKTDDTKSAFSSALSSGTPCLSAAILAIAAATIGVC